MHLRPRHLIWVEELGIAESYNRDDQYEYFMKHYNRLFGPLRRPKINEVPSDELRKGIMISLLLNLVEERRAEYADERAAHEIAYA
jgi:hypothetical protein